MFVIWFCVCICVCDLVLCLYLYLCLWFGFGFGFVFVIWFCVCVFDYECDLVLWLWLCLWFVIVIWFCIVIVIVFVTCLFKCWFHSLFGSFNFFGFGVVFRNVSPVRQLLVLPKGLPLHWNEYWVICGCCEGQFLFATRLVYLYIVLKHIFMQKLLLIFCWH